MWKDTANDENSHQQQGHLGQVTGTWGKFWDEVWEGFLFIYL